jgi:hypothetical protein
MYFANVIENNWALNIVPAFVIIGSFFFLLADLQDWWSYRIGCLFDWKHREAYEAHNTEVFQQSRYTILDRLKRAESRLNCFASVLGSSLFLAGSILFLPDLSNALTVGEALFIAGSAVIYFSQVWKVYRLACTNKINRFDTRF